MTAFTIESYQLLQQDPGDASTEILATISSQLASFATGSGFINSTAPAASLTQLSSFTPPPWAVSVNILWFISLALSLVAALFAIMVQQWIREYPAAALTSARENLRLRRFRLRGLNTWRVPMVVYILPTLLQIALILFMGGLAILMWAVNLQVALPLLVVLAVSLCVFLFFVSMPTIFPSCAYKGPLALLLRILVRRFIVAVSYGLKGLSLAALIAFGLLHNAIYLVLFFWSRSTSPRILVRATEF